jgi:hypothetical protein
MRARALYADRAAPSLAARGNVIRAAMHAAPDWVLWAAIILLIGNEIPDKASRPRDIRQRRF